MKMKLINLPRYHVFQFMGETNIHLLNENYHNKDNDNCMFEWHRIYKDGRTSLNGSYANSFGWIANAEVTDLGEYYDWMKENHPIRYKRENWDRTKN